MLTPGIIANSPSGLISISSALSLFITMYSKRSSVSGVGDSAIRGWARSGIPSSSASATLHGPDTAVTPDSVKTKQAAKHPMWRATAIFINHRISLDVRFISLLIHLCYLLIPIITLIHIRFWPITHKTLTVRHNY